MKVLHVVAAMDPNMGGVSEAVGTMASGLTELGINNEIVTMDDASSIYLQDQTLVVNALGRGKGAWRYNAKLMPWLLNNLSRFDVVIVHGLWLYHSHAVSMTVRYLKGRKRSQMSPEMKLPKIFVMPHGMLDPYFQRARGRRLKAIRNFIYWKLVERRIVNQADGELFTSEEECRLARNTFTPYHPKSEKLVGLGVAQPPAFKASMLELFYEKCPGLCGANYMLFLGRIDQKKGIDLLIAAYATVVQTFLEARRDSQPSAGLTQPATGSSKKPSIPKLVIAGPCCNAGYELFLRKMVREKLLIKDAVFFTGMIVGDAKWGAFYGCDAFVLPSHQENFGVAVVEAMACSKPVLISDQVNIWREIQAGGAGIVGSDSQQGTYEVITKWLQLADPEKSRMETAAKVTYDNCFSTRQVAWKLLNALQF